MTFLQRIPGPEWVKNFIRMLILFFLFFLVLKGVQWFLAWHFEHPIHPK
jgi:hypothetical protein